MRPSYTLLMLAVLLACYVARAGEPEYFRRDSGVFSGKQPLPDNFTDGATAVWRTELPPGNSTPCIHGDSVFLTTWDASKKELATVALNRISGEVLWKQVVPTAEIELVHPVGSPASSSPACNGEQVFAFFGSYGLLCYDLEGKLLWEKKMGPFQDEFGASSSPILADGLVILNEDHDVDSFLVAIDQETGKTIWKTPRPDSTRSYSTPIVWNAGDSKQVIVAGSLQLAGYDLATGKKQWWVNSLSRIVDPTPNLYDGLIYVATWTPGGDQTERIAMEPFPEALAALDKDNDGQVAKSELPEGSPVIPRFFRVDLNQDEKLNKLEWDRHASVFARAQNVAMAVKPGGQGDVTEQNVNWVFHRSLPTVPSSVVYEGVLYMVKDSGIITSLGASDGKMHKQGRARGRGNYYASLVAGDGKVYLTSERGVITVLKAGPQWEVLSSHDFGERIMATPVAAKGQLLIRTDEALYCIAKK
ncbi:MAG: PQQ-binding-like beta-propeller repeat protein [Planctomycetes bacterium]|nr:PQQ-binding-like beta-propeller repeat protein [Planctomycetota bacterium]